MPEPKEENIVLTPEQIIKLKAAGGLAFKLDSKFPYVPKVYREKDKNGEYVFPKEMRPVFTLKGFDGIESADMEDKLMDKISLSEDGKTETKMFTGRIKKDTCRKGIVTWKNFYDVDGSLAPTPEKDPDGMQGKYLRYITGKLMTELANAITEQKTMSQEELLGLGL